MVSANLSWIFWKRFAKFQDAFFSFSCIAEKVDKKERAFIAKMGQAKLHRSWNRESRDPKREETTRAGRDSPGHMLLSFLNERCFIATEKWSLICERNASSQVRLTCIRWCMRNYNVFLEIALTFLRFTKLWHQIWWNIMSWSKLQRFSLDSWNWLW